MTKSKWLRKSQADAMACGRFGFRAIGSNSIMWFSKNHCEYTSAHQAIPHHRCTLNETAREKGRTRKRAESDQLGLYFYLSLALTKPLERQGESWKAQEINKFQPDLGPKLSLWQ